MTDVHQATAQEDTMATARAKALHTDFWTFWTGQVVSVLGTSFTQFAVPLLIFQLTHSAVNLALTMAAEFVPYLLFGLLIGAWVDRLDRKRLMIIVDIGMAFVIGSIPLMAALEHLTVWWIYGAIFVNQTLFIFFSAAEFAAIPSLVGTDDLVTANGRIQASYFAAMVLGPLLAGALVALVPIPALLLVDAASYLVSAFVLGLIRTSFNLTVDKERKATSVRQDVVEGLRYVLSHPVLRAISAMMALVNFVGTTTNAQLVLFAKERLHATNSQIGLLFAAGGAGVVVFSLAAGRLRKRWSFSKVALGSLMLSGLLTVVFALVPWFWLAVPTWLLATGVAGLFNINTGSLRQAIVPNDLLGRVVSIAGVLAWSAIPLGALLGGLAIQWTRNVALVYAAIGVLMFLIPLAFSFTALGRAEHYLPQQETSPAEDPEATSA
jgi:MFS family permease